MPIAANGPDAEMSAGLTALNVRFSSASPADLTIEDMSGAFRTVLLALWLAACPLAAAADQSADTHATRGVVEHIDDAALGIVRFAHRGVMTFVLTADTRREGRIAVGAVVAVRYREEGGRNIATAVMVEPPRFR